MKTVSDQHNAGLLGNRLVAKGLITPEQLSICLRQQRLLYSQGQSVRIGELLVRSRFCTNDDILRTEAEKYSGAGATEEVVPTGDLLPIQICERYGIEPVEVSGMALVVRASRALAAHEKRKIMEGCATRVTELRVLPAERAAIHEFIQASRSRQSFDAVLARMLAEAEHSPTLLGAAMDSLLREAVTNRVSDIHIELKPDPQTGIRYRVDGIPAYAYFVPQQVMAPLFSRLKAESGMDASNTRSAQDGRISRVIDNKQIGFRVSSQPLVNGESMVIRIIDGSRLPTIDSLFPAQPMMHQLFNKLRTRKGKSGGVVLITGPTGSGKSTTLYTLVSALPRTELNVMTVENPVEFEIPLVKQIQVQEMAGQKPTDMERNLLRQDPDVIIMGEVRDRDSAWAALKFAESGHLVLTTLHANTAQQSIERFCSMLGVDDRAEIAFLLATTLLAVINQVLLPRLCDCATVVDTGGIGEGFEFGGSYFAKVMAAGECKKCKSGYLGRVAGHDTLIANLSAQEREQVAREIAATGSFDSLIKHPSVKHLSRLDVAKTLLAAGVIDLPSARIAEATLDVGNAAVTVPEDGAVVDELATDVVARLVEAGLGGVRADAFLNQLLARVKARMGGDLMNTEKGEQ